jgi:hypothetical protein
VNREELSGPLGRAFAVQPVESVIVPMALIVPLVMTAREVVFDSAQPGLLASLDRVSEPVADMLDLPFHEHAEEREKLRLAVERVKQWLDAGCITFPPTRHVRKLVEALT